MRKPRHLSEEGCSAAISTQDENSSGGPARGEDSRADSLRAAGDPGLNAPINLLYRELQRSLPQALIHADVEIDGISYALVAVTPIGGKIAVFLIDQPISLDEYRKHRRGLQDQGVLLVPIFTPAALQIEEERLLEGGVVEVRGGDLPLLLMLNGDEVFVVAAAALYRLRAGGGDIQRVRANVAGVKIATQPQRLMEGMLRMLHGSLIVDRG